MDLQEFMKATVMGAESEMLQVLSDAMSLIVANTSLGRTIGKK